MTGPWDVDSHHSVMVVTMVFAWEIGLAFVFMFCLAMVVYRIEKRRAGAESLPEEWTKGYQPLAKSDEKVASLEAALSSSDEDFC